MRPHRAALAAALAALVAFAGCGGPEPGPDREPEPPAFGFLAERFHNAAAGYSVAMPAGWRPNPASDADLVVFERDGAAATFSVVAVPAGESPADRVEATRSRFAALPVGAAIKPAQAEVGEARDAAEGFVGRATSGGGLVLRMLAVDAGADGGWVLVFEATPEADAATAGERAAILRGFRRAAARGSR